MLILLQDKVVISVGLDTSEEERRKLWELSSSCHVLGLEEHE